MRKQRIGVRLEETERRRLEKLVSQGKFPNVSEAIREALEQFFKKESTCRKRTS